MPLMIPELYFTSKFFKFFSTKKRRTLRLTGEYGLVCSFLNRQDLILSNSGCYLLMPNQSHINSLKLYIKASND